MNEGKDEDAKRALVKIETLFNRRLEEGITDRIQTMANNYGFVDGNPIQIDVGRIRNHPQLDLIEKERIMTQFHSWIEDTFPTLLIPSPAET